ncbi:hypothetical protein ACFLXY_11595 [Chloroflexota bacterium]
MLKEKQKEQIQREAREAYQASIEEVRSKEIVKRLPAVGSDDINDGYFDTSYQGKIYNSTSELVAEPKHNYESFGELAQDIIRAGLEDGYQSQKLTTWKQTTTKLIGGTINK